MLILIAVSLCALVVCALFGFQIHLDKKYALREERIEHYITGSAASADIPAEMESAVLEVKTRKSLSDRFYELVSVDTTFSLYTKEYTGRVIILCFLIAISVMVSVCFYMHSIDVFLRDSVFEKAVTVVSFLGLWVLASLTMVKIHFFRFHAKYNKKLLDQLPDVVFMIARCLKVGVSLPRSLEIVATQAPEASSKLFQGVVHQVAMGKDLGEALDKLCGSGGIREYRFFAVVIRLQARSGGGLAEILESFASTIRKRIQSRKKAVALASEARTSCYVLAGLPICMAFLMRFMNPGYLDVLYTTQTGIKMTVTAVVLFVLGISSMVAITKMTLR